MSQHVLNVELLVRAYGQGFIAGVDNAQHGGQKGRTVVEGETHEHWRRGFEDGRLAHQAATDAYRKRVRIRPNRCVECDREIPRARTRGSAFGGRGRPRKFCSAQCRQRASRSSRAADREAGFAWAERHLAETLTPDPAATARKGSRKVPRTKQR